GVLSNPLDGDIGQTTLLRAGVSFLIRVSLDYFPLGFCDNDDLLFYPLGASAGALIASSFCFRGQWGYVTLTAVLAVVFIVLVILGPSLGDPDRVAEVNAPRSIPETQISDRLTA